MPQTGKFRFDDVPDQAVVDVGLAVDQKVPESDDPTVLADALCRFRSDPGQPGECFSYDFEFTLDGGSQYRLPSVIFERLVPCELVQERCRPPNIVKILADLTPDRPAPGFLRRLP